MTYLFILSHSVPPGIISTIFPLLIQTLGALGESISYLVSIFSLKHGWLIGTRATPVAFETKFRWVLAGPTSQLTPESFITSHRVCVTSGNDLLQQFWEIEENTKHEFNQSPEERSFVQHFEKTHCRALDSRFIVPLPKFTNTNM